MRALLVAGLTVLAARAGSAQSDTLRLYSRQDPVPPLDPNGFLFNPHWLNAPPQPPDIERACRFRVITGNLEERALVTSRARCLSRDERALVTLNEPGSTLGIGLVCASSSQIGDVRGHVNWFPVTATGQLRWAGYSGALGADGDLTFDFATPKPNAVTSGNPKPRELGRQPAYHIEFYYLETLHHTEDTLGSMHGGVQSWWHALNHSLENSGVMKQLVDRRLAVVTGLFGLDGIHAFQAELHPVFAMSVLIDTTRTASGRLREQWAVMVRNRGNQGDCALGSLPIVTTSDSVQSFVVDLRAWPKAGAPRVYLGPSVISDPGHTPRVRADSEHLYIGVTYPRADAGLPAFLLLGTLYVEWSSDGAGAALSRFRHWLPEGAPALNLGSLTPEIESPAAVIERRRPRVAPGLPGGELVQAAMGQDSLHPVRMRRLDVALPQPLDALEPSWHPAVGARAERTVTLLIPKQVIRACPPRDPVCRRPRRLIFGGTLGPPRYGFVGYYVYAHGFRALKRVPGVGDVLSGFGYRLEGRKDTFRRDCAAACSPRSVEVWNVRLSAVLAPNSIRLGSLGTVATYFIWGGGVSWSHDQPRRFTWGVGVGGQLHTRVLSGVFVDVQNYGMVGGFLNHWTLNLGYVL